MPWMASVRGSLLGINQSRKNSEVKLYTVCKSGQGVDEVRADLSPTVG